MRGVPLWVPSPARRFLRAASSTGTSRFPCIEFPCMRGVFDPAEPSGVSRWRLRPCCLPLRLTESALRIAVSGLYTQPARAPVNASRHTLRCAAHDSGSGRFATPFLYDSFIHYSMPVLTGAPGGSAYPTLKARGFGWKEERHLVGWKKGMGWVKV